MPMTWSGRFVAAAICVMEIEEVLVASMQWGGEGLIYSGSQDRTIKVWRDTDVSMMNFSFFISFMFQLVSL
mgnify:CR=1 FL=1